MNLTLFLTLSTVLLLVSLLALAWLIQRIQHKRARGRTALPAAPRTRIQPARFKSWSRLRALAVLLATVTLAALPPALVMADRWFRFIDPDELRATWCQSPYLCSIWLPSYFLLVFVAVVCLLILMFFQRRDPIVVVENRLVATKSTPAGQHQARVGLYVMLGSTGGFGLLVIASLVEQKYPGWSLVVVWLAFLTGCLLRTAALTTVRDAWKRNGALWTACLLAYLAIAGVLAGYYGHPQFLGATVVILALALVNLWRFRQRVPLIFWIMSLALVVYTLNLNGWWTSVVGDEYGFPGPAWELVHKSEFAELGRALFRADGVYGTHPIFSSILQAIPMKFLGYDNFSWRFSNPLLCSLALGLFYLFCKTFISRRLSLVAAFLVAVSSYLMSFGKVGYNNLQALLALMLILALAAWAVRSRLPLAFVGLGSALAMCFYIYPAALYVIPVPFLLLALYYPPLTRKKVGHWALLMGVWLALLYPLIFQPVYWQTKAAGTFFNQPDLLQSIDTLANHFVNNIVYAFFSFLYLPHESHFIAVSYLDPLTGAFFLIGFCLLLFQLRRQRFAIFVLLNFVFFIVTVGASHDRETPPNTRMFLLLPLYAIIATWGVIWFETKVRQVLTARAGTSTVILPILLIAIAGVNLYQAYPLSHLRADNYQMLEALFIRISQHVDQANPNTLKDYVLVIDDHGGIEGLLRLQQLYPHLARARIHQLRLTEPALSESDLPLLANRNTLVMLAPWLDPNWEIDLDAPLRALGKKSCDIATTTGVKRFALYHDPDLPQACDP